MTYRWWSISSCSLYIYELIYLYSQDSSLKCLYSSWVSTGIMNETVVSAGFLIILVFWLTISSRADSWAWSDTLQTVLMWKLLPRFPDQGYWHRKVFPCIINWNLQQTIMSLCHWNLSKFKCNNITL